MQYRHHYTDGSAVDWALGKTVCVGRNYADHARELNNPIPDEPLLFIKPGSAAVGFADVLAVPRRFGMPHYETEMTLLIGETLCCCDEAQARGAIAGLGVGLDLTLRERQADLKQQGLPWERAKAFDGSCVLSSFVRYTQAINLQSLEVSLWQNGSRVQQGNTSLMLFPVIRLLCEISSVFTLHPGDVVMTGTPKGVGPLADGDELVAQLGQLIAVSARVASV